jgi:hypothetical protein
MNQSTDSTSTRPIAGMLGNAFKVAARITMAEPGTPVRGFRESAVGSGIYSRYGSCCILIYNQV